MLRRSVVLLSDRRAVWLDAQQHVAAWSTWRPFPLLVVRPPFSHPFRTFWQHAYGDSGAMPPRPSSAAGAAAATSKLPADFGKKIQPIYDAIDSKSVQPLL